MAITKADLVAVRARPAGCNRPFNDLKLPNSNLETFRLNLHSFSFLAWFGINIVGLSSILHLVFSF